MPLETAVLTLELVPGIGATGVSGSANTGAISLNNNFTPIPCGIYTVATSPGAVVGGNISVAVSGPQRVYARVTFADATDGELQVQANGTVIATASVLNGTGCIFTLLPAAAQGDTISLLARTTASSAAGNIVPSGTGMTVVSYGVTPFEGISMPLAGISINPNSYTNMTFAPGAGKTVTNVPTYITDDNTTDTLIASAQGFIVRSDISNRITVKAGGTYLVTANATTSVAGAYIQLQVASAQTTESLNVFSASAESSGGGHASNLTVSSYVYLPPNSDISIAALSRNAPSVPQTITRGSLMIQRVSTSVQTLNGQPDFGVHYASVLNDVETITTYGSQYSSLAGFTTRRIPAGTYCLLWTLDCDVSAPASVFYFQLQIDGVPVDRMSRRPLVSGTYEKVSSASNIVTFANDGSHTVNLATRISDSYPLAAVKTRKVRLEMFQVV